MAIEALIPALLKVVPVKLNSKLLVKKLFLAQEQVVQIFHWLIFMHVVAYLVAQARFVSASVIFSPHRFPSLDLDWFFINVQPTVDKLHHLFFLHYLYSSSDILE